MKRIPIELEKQTVKIAQLEIQHKTKSRPNYDKIIESHLPLIAKIARNQINNSALNINVELCDLIQVGSIALMEAIERFDTNREPYIQLSTYSYKFIEGSIKAEILSLKSGVYMPTVKIYEFLKLKKQNATDKEIAERLNIPEERVPALKNSYTSSKVSLDCFENYDNVLTNDNIKESSIPSSYRTNGHLASFARRDLRKIGISIELWCKKYLTPEQFNAIKLTAINFLLFDETQEYYSITGAARVLNTSPQKIDETINYSKHRLIRSKDGRNILRVLNIIYKELQKSGIKNKVR